MEKLKEVISYLLDRLQEPSTIRGIVLLAAALGAKISNDMEIVFLEMGLLLAGLIAILTPDSLLKDKVDVSKRRSGGMLGGRGRSTANTQTKRSSRNDDDNQDEYDIKG